MKIKVIKNGVETEIEVFKVYETEAEYLSDMTTEVEKGSKDLQARVKEFELKEKDSNLTKELLNLGVKDSKVAIMKKLLTDETDVKKQVADLIKEHPEFKVNKATIDYAESNADKLDEPKEKTLTDKIMDNKDSLMLETI